MSDQQRKATSIIVVIIFLSVLFFPRIGRQESYSDNQARLFFHRLKTKIESVFEEGTPVSVVTQSVVEEESSVTNVVEKVSPSVVSIVIETLVFDPFSGPLSSEEGIGTGFIVDPTGIVVTNSHVVDDIAGEYSVVTNDGETYEVTKIHLDEPTDLAILEINARGLIPIELGDSDSIKVGQRAIAIGNALGRYSNTVTVGVISGIARELTAIGRFGNTKTYEGAIQTDAALNPGNSGGPLLNSSGQLVGINVATTAGADNIGFAIPINNLKLILETFFEEGRIIRPYLGVSYSIITEEISRIREFPEGAFVSRVFPDTPAEKAGLERGDIITVIDGDLINADNPLGKVIIKYKVGDFVELTVDREGETLTFGVTLEEAPDSP
jgi:S1-C subfamily serine protease